MKYRFDYTQYQPQLLGLFQELERLPGWSAAAIQPVLQRYRKPDGQPFRKSELVIAYRALAGQSPLKTLNRELLRSLQMKPTRTISGVAPVTVLTKPFPCPGQCIFCPNDIRMPKSYLADEPGAQRAERNGFDPYLQTYNRLLAYQNIGHQTDKVELIILGGTWSYYPESYQIWFIRECFRALNEFGQGLDGRAEIIAAYQAAQRQLKLAQQKLGHSTPVPSTDPAQNQQQLAAYQVDGQQLDQTYNQVVAQLYTAPEQVSGLAARQTASWLELAAVQHQNETAQHRCVGLVIETRPDNISAAEVRRIRRLGCTKTQIGFQSLQDEVLRLNKRGHDVAATRRAVRLLRQAGFKVHAHWMPNLYGSTPELDKADYHRLFADPDFCPDELKIYPCSLIASAELMQYYQRGEWQPYTEAELLDVLGYCLRETPRYCRLTRVIRDIPSTDIVVGNKKTNFRELVEQQLAASGERSQNIRAREVRQRQVSPTALELVVTEYPTSTSRELFLEYVTRDSAGEHLAAFLRLSLPTEPSFLPELQDCALIREVHVYGQAVAIGQREDGKAQHAGLGSRLITRAKQLAAQAGFHRLAVISAVGTREYYRQRGFADGELYQVASLTAADGRPPL